MDYFFRWFCHQLPSRSPQWDADVFPLCWRCAGLHLGLVCSYLSLIAGGSWKKAIPGHGSVVCPCLMTVPLMVDGWGNLLGLWSSPGWWRSVTGLGVGIALPLLLLFVQTCSSTEAPKTSPSAGVSMLLSSLMLGLAGIWLLVHPQSSLMFRSLAAASALGTILFFVNFLHVSRTVFSSRSRATMDKAEEPDC